MSQGKRSILSKEPVTLSGLRNVHVASRLGELRSRTHTRHTPSRAGSLSEPEGLCGWLLFVCVWSEARPFGRWIGSQALQEILYNQEEEEEKKKRSHLNNSQILEPGSGTAGVNTRPSVWERPFNYNGCQIKLCFVCNGVSDELSVYFVYR